MIRALFTFCQSNSWSNNYNKTKTISGAIGSSITNNHMASNMASKYKYWFLSKSFILSNEYSKNRK